MIAKIATGEIEETRAPSKKIKSGKTGAIGNREKIG